MIFLRITTEMTTQEASLRHHRRDQGMVVRVLALELAIVNLSIVNLSIVNLSIVNLAVVNLATAVLEHGPTGRLCYIHSNVY